MGAFGAGLAQGGADITDTYFKFAAMKQNKQEHELRKKIFELQQKDLEFDIKTRQFNLDKAKREAEIEPLFYQQIQDMLSRGVKPEPIGTSGAPPSLGSTATQLPGARLNKNLSLAGPTRQPLFLGAEFQNPMMQQQNLLAPSAQAPQLDLSNLLNEQLNLRGPTRDLMFLSRDSTTTKPVSSQRVVKAAQTPTPASSLMQFDDTIPSSRKDLARLLELADRSGNMDQLTFAFEKGIIDNAPFRAEQLERILKAQKAAVDYEKTANELREYQWRERVGNYWINNGEEAAGVAALGGDYGKALQLHSVYGPMMRSMTDNEILAAALEGDPKAIQLVELKLDIQKETNKTVTRVDPKTGIVEIGNLDEELPVYPKASLVKDLQQMRALQTGMGYINRVRGLIEANPGIVGTPGAVNKLIKNILINLGDIIAPEKAREIREKAFGEAATARSQMESLGELIAASYATGAMKNEIPTNQDIQLAKDSLGIDNNWFTVLSSEEALAKLESVLGTFQDSYNEIEGRKADYEQRAPRVYKPATTLQELLMRHNTTRGKILKQKYEQQQPTVKPSEKTSAAPATSTPASGIGEAADPLAKESVTNVVEILNKDNKVPVVDKTTEPTAEETAKALRYKRYLELKAKEQGN